MTRRATMGHLKSRRAPGARALAIAALLALFFAAFAESPRGASGASPAATATSHPAFFNGEAALPGGVFYYLVFPDGNLFGYYTYTFFPFLYHNDLGFEYFVDAGGPAHGAFLYDFIRSNWFYTDPGNFPYLYNFSAPGWYFYFLDGANPGHYTSNPRIFANLNTQAIIFSPPYPATQLNIYLPVLE